MDRKDNYETPQHLATWAVNYAWDVLTYAKKEPALFLEPGCGPNAPFGQAARSLGCTSIGVEKELTLQAPTETVDTSEGSLVTVRNVDFLTDFEVVRSYGLMNRDKFDIIATNPPFSKAESFIWKSLELLDDWGVMVFLLKLPFLASLKRMRLYRERPPREVHVLQKRPSFSNGGTDMTEYGFYTWLGTKRQESLERSHGSDTRLKWLDNKALSDPLFKNPH